MACARLLLLAVLPVLQFAIAERNLLALLQEQQQQHASGTRLFSAMQWLPCEPRVVHQPSSTQAVADAVRLVHADKSASRRDYRIRAARNNFYYHNNFSCSSSAQSGSTLNLVMDMSRMNRLLSVDVDAKQSGTVTVQAGMTFEALTEALLERGLGLPGWLVAPPFARMTLGEAIETASQGSATQGTASIAGLLQAAVLVDGTGHILELAEPGPLLEGSLGLLGVVTELRIRVEPARKATVWERLYEDGDIARQINQLLLKEGTRALEVMWNPSANVFAARSWKEAASDSPGDYVNGLVVAPPAWMDKVSDLLSLDQEDQPGIMKVDVMCEVLGDIATMQGYAPRVGTPRVHVPGQSRWRDSVAATGWTGRLGAARCVGPGTSGPNGQEEGCLWRRAKVTPYTMSIAAQDLEAWAGDVSDLMTSTVACTSFVVHMRFAGKSESLMSPSWGQATVSLSFISLSSLKYNGRLFAKQQHLLDELLQRTLCRYAAQPHWALSTNAMLAGRCGAHAALGAARLSRFAARRARHDPLNLFGHALWERLAGGKPPASFPGCALSGDCFCETNEHCGPGFRCVPGVAFPEHRACRMWGGENVDEQEL